MVGNATSAPDSAPELRVPALRGSLRYWFRATAGAVIGDRNIPNIWGLESQVFGNTKGGSPLSIQMPSKKFDSYSEKILPHKDKKQGEKPGYRNAFRAGSSFEIILGSRSASDEVWNTATTMLKLALTFGGLGLRARRGYGTLKIQGVTPETLENWKSYIPDLVGEAVKAVTSLAKGAGIPVLPSPPLDPCQFPCANRTGIIRIGNTTYSTAMESVKGFMGNVPKVQFLGFVGGHNRQASPLWVRPIQIKENKFCLLFVTLPSNFTGSDYPKLKSFLDNEHSGSDISVKGWNL